MDCSSWRAGLVRMTVGRAPSAVALPRTLARVGMDLGSRWVITTWVRSRRDMVDASASAAGGGAVE